MNKLQEAKALGGLVSISLKDLGNVSVVENELLPANHEKLPCGFPNALDVEIADTEPDKLAHYLDCDEESADAIHQCHRGMAHEELAGGGSWGVCNTEVYPAHHSVQYGVDVDSFPAHYHRKVTAEEIRELSIEKSPWWGWSIEEAMDRFNGKTVLDVCLLVGVEETFRLTGNAHIRVDSKPSRGIWIKSRPIPGSTIGIGWFPGSGCSSLVEFHIDSSWNPSLQPRIRLFSHECGHCNKLPHTFSGQATHHGVMSYDDKLPHEGFSTGESSRGFTLPKDPSWKLLERFYDPRPAPDLTKPPPPPPPPTANIAGELHGEHTDGKIVIRGELETAGRKFIAAPKPNVPGVFIIVPKPIV